MAQQQQRYKVIEKIASGGMAEVFRAESAGLEGFKKTVAIKRVLPHLSEKKQFMGMFLDEARLSAHLSHSNCVQVFDIGVGDNTYFIVMEYVDGSDLKGIVEYHKRTGVKMGVEEACLICVRICEGLAYAHELTDQQGNNLHIVHRDMSPPNVLLTRHGEVKIVDFGLAKANSQLEHSEPGIIKGKFSYLSPEAALGKEVDARADIFAVGIILWELLSGRRLFLGESDLETVRQVQAGRVPPIRQFNQEVSDELARVLSKALAADPNQRYSTAREMGRDLNQVLFQYGRSVSSFDLAQLVAPIWAERRAKKKADMRKSIIGTLIDETLIHFTSLEGEEQQRASMTSGAGAVPLSLGTFEGTRDWGQDLGDLMGGARPPSSTGAAFEVGNLAALEDPQTRRKPLSSTAEEALPIPLGNPLGAAPAPRSHLASLLPPRSQPPSAGMSRLGLVVALVVLFALAAAAGVYFGAAFAK